MSDYLIPQSVYERYNARYSNKTYRAFTFAHAQKFSSGQAHIDACNMLTDAALERSGAAGTFVGARERLTEGMTADLVSLVDAHLLNFNPVPERKVFNG